MIRILVVALCAVTVCVSCASHTSQGPRDHYVGNEVYQPVTKPEQIEFSRDRLDVYPDDVRTNFAKYAGTGVVWAGIIRNTDISEPDDSDKIMADTIFEHHYFNGVQYNTGHGIKLFISPRGEGLFRTRWSLNRVGKEATAESAEKYARDGKLAIVYGVTTKVDPNGTVVLRYRYLRILGPDQFSTNELDYGRFGQPVIPLQRGVDSLSMK
jgi:hypothetical protein